MAAKSKPTWIAVVDGAQARFFALRRGEDGQVFEEAAPSLTARSSRGASNGRGRGLPSAGGASRGAAEPRSDREKVEAANFARRVAGTLDAALADKKYDHLVIVAPPRNLSDMREFLSDRVSETIAHHVPKNFVNLGTDALWEKLSVILLKAARPMNGSASRVTTNPGSNLPVLVVFRNMDASSTVQAAALKYAARLGRKFGKIMNCRVIVEAPSHAHRKVKMFRVAIELKLPRHEITTKFDEEPMHADIDTALREAFATATRQMQDHLQRLKGLTVRTRRQSSPRARGVVEA